MPLQQSNNTPLPALQSGALGADRADPAPAGVPRVALLYSAATQAELAFRPLLDELALTHRWLRRGSEAPLWVGYCLFSTLRLANLKLSSPCILL